MKSTFETINNFHLRFYPCMFFVKFLWLYYDTSTKENGFKMKANVETRKVVSANSESILR